MHKLMPLLLVSVAACGGGSGGGQNPALDVPPTGGKQGPELTVSAPGELLALVKTKIQNNAQLGTTLLVQTPPLTPVAVAAPANDSGSFSNSRIQEAGVDEDDLVKTDGDTLFSLTPSYSQRQTGTGFVMVPAKLKAQRRISSTGQLAAAGELSLDPNVTQKGLYLPSSGQTVAVVGEKNIFLTVLPGTITVPPGTATVLPQPSLAAIDIAIASYVKPEVSLELVSIATPNQLQVDRKVKIDGRLVGSRMIGSYLYVVSSWSPRLTNFAIPANATTAQVNAILAPLKNEDIFPTIEIDSQPAQALVKDTECYVQAASVSLGLEITTITVFDLSTSNLDRRSRCILGSAEGLYMSPKNVYLTSSRFYTYSANAADLVFPLDGKTDIHKFALQGLDINYRASGEVAGNLGWDKDKIAYRMGEYQDDLRVLTYTGSRGWATTLQVPVPSTGTSSATTTVSASPALLTVLREKSDATLAVVGQLPNANRPEPLGKPGEQIFAVQYAGDKAYLVTFRRTDPLYVLDVSVPADPKKLGELEIHGYSDYLYPLGDKLMLGVGKDANNAGRQTGVKLALINISNLGQPALISSFTLGQAGSVSGLDYSSRGINIFRQGDIYRVALPALLTGGCPQFFCSQSLERFEIDTQLLSMMRKPAVVRWDFATSPAYDFSSGKNYVNYDRSLQVQSHVYYFSGGDFLTSTW